MHWRGEVAILQSSSNSEFSLFSRYFFQTVADPDMGALGLPFSFAKTASKLAACCHFNFIWSHRPTVYLSPKVLPVGQTWCSWAVRTSICRFWITIFLFIYVITYTSITTNKFPLQVLIVQFGGAAFSTTQLTMEQWMWCIFLGAGELLWGQVGYPEFNCCKVCTVVEF